MREGKVASIWIQILATFPSRIYRREVKSTLQILATFPSRIYRREVKSTLTQKPFGRPWVRLATCIVCFAWFRSDHVHRVHRVQRVLVCTASLHQSFRIVRAHSVVARHEALGFEPTTVYGI